MKKTKKTYLYLRDVIAERIAQGLYEEYSKLPSERELAEDLQTTRLTLRDALMQLEVEGIVFRMDRRGWFVAGKRLNFDPTLDKGFMTNVHEQGHEPKTELIYCALEPASKNIAKVLGVKTGTNIYHLKRKRSINKRPVLIEDIYLNAGKYHGLQHVNLEGSLSLVLSDVYDVKVKYSDIQITPIAFNELHAKSLQVSPGTPATLITRISYDQKGEVAEFDKEYWVSDVLKVVLRTAQK